MGEADERAAVVAWLRKQGRKQTDGANKIRAREVQLTCLAIAKQYAIIADAIERGHHLPKATPDA